jgi:site-specific DNA recombinase
LSGKRGECRKLTAALDWDVADVYIDNDVSAYGCKPRPGYRRMLEDVRQGRVSAMMAYHSDRLYRHLMDPEGLVALAEAHSPKIATVQAGDLGLSTTAGRHVGRILGIDGSRRGVAVRHTCPHQLFLGRTPT